MSIISPLSIDISKYVFRQTWFLTSALKAYLHTSMEPNRELHILEIGCYEGLSSVYLAEYLLGGNPRSTLTCVDPFLTLSTNDHASMLLTDEAEAHFDYNISRCPYQSQIFVHKVTSDTFFQTLASPSYYDFIYVDGCHDCEYIRRDMRNAWRVLKPQGGILWMDDYLGGPTPGLIKHTMDTFIQTELSPDTYRIIHRGYQLAIQKL